MTPDSPTLCRCVIYTRQSRLRGKIASSCEAQRTMCMDLATAHGWEVVGTFEDAGESSETLERPALQRLFEALQNDVIDRVVVYSVDRLTRRLFHLHHLLHRFQSHNVLLSVVTDPHFGTSAANRLMANIIATASEFEQDLTRERTSEARAMLKQKGRRVAGRIPFGYVTDIAKQLVVHDREAGHVRKIFEMAAAGQLPTNIAQHANERRWKTRGLKQPGKWTARQILKLLSNPIYAGCIRNGRETLTGSHESIVSESLFAEVQSMIASRRSRKPGRNRSQMFWALRGLLSCGRCGRRMSPSTSRRQNIRYLYYLCRSHAGGILPCRGVSLPAYEIDQFVAMTLREEEWEGQSEAELEAASRFSVIWAGLDQWTQIKRINVVVREVIFDPDEESIQVALFDDAAERLHVEQMSMV